MKIDVIVVVEGKTDVSFLSNFIEAEFVTTNGSEVSKETIEYLKESNKNIYVLTDPDSPGERIRKILDENIPNLKHCFVKKEKAIKKGKVGVAESTRSEIEEALKNYLSVSQTNKGSLVMSDLFNIGLVGCAGSEEKRKVVSDKFKLGHCNAKTFLKRLNYRGINIDELKQAL